MRGDRGFLPRVPGPPQAGAVGGIHRGDELNLTLPETNHERQGVAARLRLEWR